MHRLTSWNLPTKIRNRSHGTLSAATPSNHPALRIECSVEPEGTLVVRVIGDVDQDSSHVLQDALAVTRFPRTVVDLRHVTFAGCELLNVLLRARQADHRLQLAGPLARSVQRLFDLTGTGTVFPVIRATDRKAHTPTAPRTADMAPLPDGSR